MPPEVSPTPPIEPTGIEAIDQWDKSLTTWWGPRLIVRVKDGTKEEEIVFTKNLGIIARIRACFGAGPASFNKVIECAANVIDKEKKSTNEKLTEFEGLLNKIKNRVNKYNEEKFKFKHVSKETINSINVLIKGIQLAKQQTTTSGGQQGTDATGRGQKLIQSLGPVTQENLENVSGQEGGSISGKPVFTTVQQDKIKQVSLTSTQVATVEEPGLMASAEQVVQSSEPTTQASGPASQLSASLPNSPVIVSKSASLSSAQVVAAEEQEPAASVEQFVQPSTSVVDALALPPISPESNSLQTQETSQKKEEVAELVVDQPPVTPLNIPKIAAIKNEPPSVVEPPQSEQANEPKPIEPSVEKQPQIKQVVSTIISEPKLSPQDVVDQALSEVPVNKAPDAPIKQEVEVPAVVAQDAARQFPLPVAVVRDEDLHFDARSQAEVEMPQEKPKEIPLTDFEKELDAWVKCTDPKDSRRIVLENNAIKFKNRGLLVGDSRSGTKTISKVANLCVEYGYAVEGLYEKLVEYNKTKKKTVVGEDVLEKIHLLELLKYSPNTDIETFDYFSSETYQNLLEGAIVRCDIKLIDLISAKLKEIEKIDVDTQAIFYTTIKGQTAEKQAEILEKLKNTIVIRHIVNRAISYSDVKLLRYIQENAVYDNAHNLPLHHICQREIKNQNAKSHDVKIAATLISMCKDPQKLMVPGNSGKYPFILACQSQNEELATLLLERGVYSFVDATKQVPLFSMSEKSQLSNAQKNIAKLIISNATLEELNGRYGIAKEAILVKLFENKHTDLAFAFIDRCLKENPTEAMLYTTWFTTILNQPLDSKVVDRIVEGLKEKSGVNPTVASLLARFDRVQKSGIEKSDALRTAFFIQKHCSNNQINYKSLKADLDIVPLSDTAVTVFMQEARQLVAQDPHIQAVDAQLQSYGAHIGKGFHKNRALMTAIIFSVDVPKIEKLFAKSFEHGGLLTEGTEEIPEGWRIFKEKSKITVITPQKLGEGAFKRAVTSVETIYEKAQARIAELSVFLEPKDKFVSQREQEEFEYEMAMFELLGPSEYIVKALAVRTPGKKPLLGRIDEVGVDFEHAFKGKIDSSPQAVLQRLDCFDDILNGLEFMHKKNIIHGDLKTPNCVLVKGKGKITDLGTSAEVGKDKKIPYSFTKKSYGTPCYSSPYIKTTSTPSDVQMKGADMWALGMMLKDLYDGKQFQWSNHEKIDTLPDWQLRDLVVKELTPIFEKLEQNKQKQPWTKEEQTKYHVYDLMKGLLGVRVEQEQSTQKLTVSLDEKALFTTAQARAKLQEVRQEISKLV